VAKLDVFHRYLHIVNFLLKKPASLDEINDYLSIKSEQDGLNYIVSNRTFLRDKEAIFSLFKLDIQYNNKENQYYISEDDSPEDVHQRLLEAFSTFNALQFTQDIPNKVQFEKRRPQGLEFFRTILQAISQQRELVFDYKKFYEDKPQRRNAQPLLLKEYKHRWYLLALDTVEQDIRTFGLDRMDNLLISTKKYKKDKQMLPETYFQHAFGIMKPNNEALEETILSFNAVSGNYVKTMPFHHSQKILIDTEDELRISLKVHLTQDFILELLSHGAYVKILQPAALVDRVKQALQDALQQYK